MRVAIVGSGFAGSILARILLTQGHDVTLIERGAHPRFAIGESSTPLAAICLERLSDRYGMPDLRDLAAYGRWTDAMPNVRRGLKRGFTFFGHEHGRPYTNTMQNAKRLLVAASPHDSIADAHWLRADVDHHLATRATEAGVNLQDRTRIDTVDIGATAKLTGVREGKPVTVDADFAVDATGSNALFATQLGIPPAHRLTDLSTALVFAHFENVRPFAEVAGRETSMPKGPYEDDRAAVHHLLEEGWMYQLPFDHGVTSAGFVIERGPQWTKQEAINPQQLWAELLEAYPSIADQFADANAVTQLRVVPRLQHAVASATGPKWALLPQAFAFWSPMFSTGIAWSLVAVERLAMAFESPASLNTNLARYEGLLRDEARYLEQLIAGSYATRRDFDMFAEYAMLYFAAASFAEASQRLLDFNAAGDAWCWDGFLGARDPVLTGLVESTSALVRSQGVADPAKFARSIGSAIASRNLAGLANPGRNRLYPVDLDALVEKADLLGLTTDEIRSQLPRLRGMN